MDGIRAVIINLDYILLVSCTQRLVVYSYYFQFFSFLYWSNFLRSMKFLQGQSKFYAVGKLVLTAKDLSDSSLETFLIVVSPIKAYQT